jgi:hypothetical protein
MTKLTLKHIIEMMIFGNQILVCPILEPNALAGECIFHVVNGTTTGQIIW